MTDIVAADVPLTVHEAARMFKVRPAIVLQATRQYSSSGGKLGLKSFRFPGSSKVKIRPSSFISWIESLEECV